MTTTLAFKHVGDRTLSLWKATDTFFGVTLLGDGDGCWTFPNEAEARRWFDAFDEGDRE